MKSFYLFFAFTFLLACKNQKATTEVITEEAAAETKTETLANAQPGGDSLVAYLERTACYGQCPMYKFSIYNSGHAVYEGKRFVEKTGTWHAIINPPVLDEIRAKAKAIHYFEFKDEYPKTASDFPAVKTAVVIDGKRKDIMDGSNAPSALKEFEKYLDSVKDGVEWKQAH